MNRVGQALERIVRKGSNAYGERIEKMIEEVGAMGDQ